MLIFVCNIGTMKHRRCYKMITRLILTTALLMSISFIDSSFATEDRNDYSEELSGTLQENGEAIGENVGLSDSKKKFSVKIHNSGTRVDTQKETLQAFNDLKNFNDHSAKELYKSIIKSNPSDRNALLGMAVAFHRLKEHDKAMLIYLEIIKSRHKTGHREIADKALHNAMILIGSNPNKENLLKGVEIFEKHQHSSLLAVQISSIYTKLGEFNKALQYMNIATNLEPRNIKFGYYMGLIMEKSNNKEQALSLYRHMLNNPESYDINPGEDTINKIRIRANKAIVFINKIKNKAL